MVGALSLGAGSFLSADDSAISWQLESDSDILERGRSLVDRGASRDREPRRQVLQSTKVAIGMDGIVAQVQRVWHFPTVESVQEFGSDVIPFDGHTDSVVVREAATILPDGTVVRFDPANAQVVDSDTYSEFSDDREAVILFPRLEPGSLAVVHFDVSTDRDAMEVPWSNRVFPQQLFPRNHFEFTVSWVPGIELKWANDSPHLSCDSAQWRIKCVGRDIPAAAFDPDVNWRDELGQMVISEYRDWNHVVGVAVEAFDKALHRTDGATRVLRSLIDDGMSRETVIARLFEFVAREIRYVAVSERGHAITPHTVEETLDRRYGDCKDKSALLTHLLNLAGIDAHPVLVATRRMDPERLRVASATYFDHMLVCIKLDSVKRCLDTVDSYTDVSSTAHWVQGRVALDLVQGSEPTVVPHDPYRWQVRVETSIGFAADGSQSETSVRSYLGASAGLMRGFLANGSNDQLVRWASEEYERTVGEMAEPTFEFSGLDNLAEPFSVHSTASYPALVDAQDDLDYSERSAWLAAELNGAVLENRHHRSFFPGLRVSTEYSFAVPPKWEFEWAGPSLNLEFEYGSMTREIQLDETGVRFSTLLEMPSRWVAEEDTDRFNAFVKALSRQGQMSMYARLVTDP